MHIVHLDLKPENILLDNNMVPKIADFCLSRNLDEKQSRFTTKNVYGTVGYLAPEFIRGGDITYKSDMYSLGIIITEITTGKKSDPDIENVLESWRNRLEKSKADTQLLQVRVCTEIALECTESNPTRRPDIQDVINRLGATKSMDYSVTEIGASSS
ncbi:cysteine-rich receptor-like protein kinase 27 [Triticum dicoccoides]|uniref:cysteine-rich receptor-like protein kinase 27 n=1 Tax=Triticum dicoccoides TaxID=85692 RepID=UPI001890921E|nr:cysteine-rich receptor-like protein kinase 27 [Triticum dicoccoides]